MFQTIKMEMHCCITVKHIALKHETSSFNCWNSHGAARIKDKKKWNTIEIPSATLWCNMWNNHILTETSKNHKICWLDLSSYSSLVVQSTINVDEWQRWGGGGRWRQQQHKEQRQLTIADPGGRTAPQRQRDVAFGTATAWYLWITWSHQHWYHVPAMIWSLIAEKDIFIYCLHTRLYLLLFPI